MCIKDDSSFLKTEALYFLSKSLTFYETTRRQLEHDGNLGRLRGWETYTMENKGHSKKNASKTVKYIDKIQVLNC
jgi:hypothetical protein